jgi:hypothetical protein
MDMYLLFKLCKTASCWPTFSIVDILIICNISMSRKHIIEKQTCSSHSKGLKAASVKIIKAIEINWVNAVFHPFTL